MKNILIIGFGIFWMLPIFCQETPLEDKVLMPNVQFAETINAADLKVYLSELASDAYQGRETGEKGNTLAAEYIASQLKEFGISPLPNTDTYFQEVAFTRMKWKSIKVQVNGLDLQHQRDFLMIPPFNTNDEINIDTKEFTFLGYGIDDELYSDYADNDVAGKVVLVYGGEPVDEVGNYLLSGNKIESEWTTDYFKKLLVAKKAGVKMLIIIGDDLREDAGTYRSELIGGSTLMGHPDMLGSAYPANMKISSTQAKVLLGKKMKKVIKARKKILKKRKLKAVQVKTDLKVNAEKQVSFMPGVNVLAYIEGSDPKVKDEVVVISAHYDHVGFRGDDIYNGADDNASGTSGVMEIAQAFQAAKDAGKGPRRSILCLWVTGEEKGLLGSQYYAENPIFPLEKTVADINIDMIGRMDDKHTTPDYIYVIGSNRLSTELHDINESVNKNYTNLELDYTYNAEDDPNRFYYRSDHYNFAKNGIPSVFFFSGVHEDYHRPTDTADKIMYEKAAKISKLAFYNAWELANRPKRIKVDVGENRS